MNYSVSSSSPTDELLTLGQIFSEVGDYASTILDREHLSLSRRCVTRLNKVVAELVSRQCILTADNLYDMPDIAPADTDLKSLSIDDLHSLYRRWPIRHNERRAEGRESMSFYYEGRIVGEMKSRSAANKGEQLKIDYCVAMYSNELSNLSYLFSCPVQIDNNKLYPNIEKHLTPEELTVLISLYKDYRDVVERELLVEYVDQALDILDKDASSCLGLLAEVTEVARRKIIRVPEWINKKLESSVKLALSSKTGKDAELVRAMLILAIINEDSSWERKARRIINRCYRSVFEGDADLIEKIENLHTAVTCCDYVTRFSVRKSAAVWNEMASQALSADERLFPQQIFQLLEVAKECENYVNISAESKAGLKQMLETMACIDSPATQAYSKIAKLRF